MSRMEDWRIGGFRWRGPCIATWLLRHSRILKHQLHDAAPHLIATRPTPVLTGMHTYLLRSLVQSFSRFHLRSIKSFNRFASTLLDLTHTLVINNDIARIFPVSTALHKTSKQDHANYYRQPNIVSFTPHYPSLHIRQPYRKSRFLNLPPRNRPLYFHLPRHHRIFYIRYVVPEQRDDKLPRSLSRLYITVIVAVSFTLRLLCTRLRTREVPRRTLCPSSILS